jgi:protein-S-isoprenylcysteine O-methyltransferase Ste14
MTTATAAGLNRSRLIRWLLVSVVVGATTMALAGQWTSPYLWGFTIGISAIFLYASVSVLDDDLARERFRPPSAGADAVALRWIRVSAVAAFVTAPLDGGRLHWGPVVPEIIRSLGLGLSLVGFWLVVDAMKTNRFFSPVIRIQDERGHRVVDQGPYAVIRHPGYLGMMTFAPGAVLAFGSWWALIPAGLYWALILRRVVAEDRFLRANLDGYAQYAMRVRSRVIPGVW